MRCCRFFKDVVVNRLDSCLDNIFSIEWVLLKNVGVLYYAYWWHYEGVFHISVQCRCRHLQFFLAGQYLKTVWIKCCFFIQTILSFAVSRKIINIYNGIALKYGMLQLTISKMWKTRVQKEETKIRHWLSQQLETTWCVSEIPYL